jgi:hypothetical protein
MEYWNNGYGSLHHVEKYDESLTDKNIHGEIVIIDPKSLDPNTEVMRF